MRVPSSRDFRTLIVASIASQLGDWAARLALSLLVFARTGDATAVGLVAALLVLPWLGPGQWLAIQGDRLDRRTLLIICDLIRGVTFLLIGLVDLPIPVLLLAVFVAATADPVFEANRSALIVDLVPGDDYPPAIQLANAINQGAQLAGFAVGGVLSAALGPSGALSLNGATFLVSAALISRIRTRTEAQRSGAKPSLTQAWQFLAGDRLSLVAVATTFTTVAAAMAIESQAAVYGPTVAGLGEAGTGLLAATVPAATFTSIVLLKTEGGDRAVLHRGLALAFGASVSASLALARSSDRAGVFVGYALVGVVFTFSTAANIAVGRRIPGHIRSGTFGVLQALVFVATSLGAAAGGAAAQLAGSRSAASAAMILSAAACVIAAVGLRDERNTNAASP